MSGSSAIDYAHHEFEVISIDPNELEIDEVNERTLGAGPRTTEGDLEQSILENGIEDPPQARPNNDGSGYKVFAGQRRVLAAQAVGLDEIPVIVKNLDDMEALAASINENNEHLKKDVSRKDRARAIQRLEKEWPRNQIADHFGVEPQTIANWLEPVRPFWEDTMFDPSVQSERNTDYIANDVLADLRRVMVKTHLAEGAARVIIDKKIPKKVVREALKLANNPAEFMEELETQWKAISAGKVQINPRITLTGVDAERLQEYAKNRGISEELAVKQIVTENLADMNED